MKIIGFLKKKKKAIKQLFSSLLLLAIAAGIGIFIGLKETNGIQKYVNEVKDYIKDNNWIALYNYAERSDTDFINEYFFNEFAGKTYGEIKEVKLGEVQENNDNAIINLNCENDDGKTIAEKLTLIKKPEKNYKFFNQWKIDIDSFIVEECTITVPKDFEVYVDGVGLSEENTIKTENGETGAVTYSVPEIFKGEHVLYLANDLVDVYETTINLDEDKASFVLDTTQLKLIQSETDILKINSENIIQLMYKGVFEKTGIEGLNTYILQDEQVNANLTSIYDGMISAIEPDDGSTLNSMNITGFRDFAMEYQFPDKASVTISFDCSFKARGGRSQVGGIREKYEGTTSSTIKLTFVRNENGWLCNALDMSCIDYSKKEETE